MRGPSAISPKRSGVDPSPVPTTAQLRRFFAAIGPRVETNAVGSLLAKAEVVDFFTIIRTRVKAAEEQQRRIDRRLATGFNVFHLIEPDENKLSDILADLLDPGGTHGQGDLFLRVLFERVGLGSAAKLTKNAKVQREAPTHGILKYRRRMDVLVDAGALLVIENKLDALEQRDQIRDYLAHLDICLRGRKSRLLYLTRDGRPPESLSLSAIEEEQIGGRLHCWSYQEELRDWLESCRRQCRAPRIGNFLKDFVTHIDTELRTEAVQPTLEELNGN
jgi:hypothetical protein